MKMAGKMVLAGVGVVCSLNLLAAQTSTVRSFQIGSTAGSSLAAMVAVVAQTTPLPADATPVAGTYYSAQHPEWPPAPANFNNLPAWSLGGRVYMLSDLDFDYQAQAQARSMMWAMDDGPPTTPGGSGDEGGGSGSGSGTGYSTRTFTADELWLELVALTNATGFFLVHPPASEVGTGVYDLFATTNLTTNVPGLNLTNWVWLLRSDTS